VAVVNRVLADGVHQVFPAKCSTRMGSKLDGQRSFLMQ
jgi:hypothetical protein